MFEPGQRSPRILTFVVQNTSAQSVVTSTHLSARSVRRARRAEAQAGRQRLLNAPPILRVQMVPRLLM